MTERRRKRISTGWAIFYGSLLVVSLSGLLARVLLMHADGFGWVQVSVLLLAIVAGTALLIVGLLALFAWMDRARTRELARLFPQAFIVEVLGDATLAAGARSFARRSTGERPRIPSNAYLSLVVDRSEFRFFRGGSRPRQVTAFPSSVIERVEIGSAVSGARIVASLELVCRAGTAEGRIGLKLMRFGRLLPHFLTDEALDDAAGRFSVAAGVAGSGAFTAGSH